MKSSATRLQATNNGSGMTGLGSTRLSALAAGSSSRVRAVAGCAWLNNARWALGVRRGRLAAASDEERAEPTPLGVSHRAFVIVSPTLAPGYRGRRHGVGGRRAEFLEVDPAARTRAGIWFRHGMGAEFTEHSYRTLPPAEPTANSSFRTSARIRSGFLDKAGAWKTGKLVWPEGEDPQRPCHDLRAQG